MQLVAEEGGVEGHNSADMTVPAETDPAEWAEADSPEF